MTAPVAKRRALAGGYADGKGSSRRTGVQAPVWTAPAAFGALAALDAVGEPSSGKAVTKVLVMGSAHGAWAVGCVSRVPVFPFAVVFGPVNICPERSIW